MENTPKTDIFFWLCHWKPVKQFSVLAVIFILFCALVNSALMSKLTAHCQWEDETTMERTGHSPLYVQGQMSY